MTTQKYRQCKMQRKVDDGLEISVGYVEVDQKLKVGARLSVKTNRQDDWSNGWVVVSLGDPLEKEDIGESDYKHWRDATDI